MKTTDKIISFFTRLETLNNDEWLELDLKMNELVHDESKNEVLKEIIEESKRQLNEQERYAFEASLHRSATNIVLFNEKTKKEERLSLLVLPVSLVWNEKNEPSKIEPFFEQSCDISKIFKKFKLISKHSEAIMIPHWMSFNQLEQTSIKDLSDYLKQFCDNEDVLNLTLKTPFIHEKGEMLYIPILILESVFDDNVFIDNYDNLSQEYLSEINETISNQLSSDNCLVVPYTFSEFHEALSTTKSSVFVDELLYHLEQALILKTPIKTIYLIKKNDSIVFSATDIENTEIYNISIFINSERILTEVLDSTRYNLELENQIKLIEDKSNILKFAYIGNLN